MPEQWSPLFNGASGEHYLGRVETTDEGNYYHCDLTNTTHYGLKEWQEHVASNKFQSALQKTRDELRHFFHLRDLARQKCPQILALKHKPWQDACFANMARVLVNDEDEKLIVDDIEPLLAELELLETISVLELAVWKALCQANCPDHVNGYFAFQQWLKDGWKTKKAHYRRSGQVVAIMKSVMPFVDQSNTTTAKRQVDTPGKPTLLANPSASPQITSMIHVLEEKTSTSNNNSSSQAIVPMKPSPTKTSPVKKTIHTSMAQQKKQQQPRKIVTSSFAKKKTTKTRTSFPDLM